MQLVKHTMEMMDRLLFSRRSSHHQWKLLHCFFLILIVLPLLTLFLSYKCNLSTYRLSFSLSKQWAMNKSILRGIVISINVWKHTPVRHCIMYQYPTPIDKFAYNSLYTCSSTTSSLYFSLFSINNTVYTHTTNRIINKIYYKYLVLISSTLTFQL